MKVLLLLQILLSFGRSTLEAVGSSMAGVHLKVAACEQPNVLRFTKSSNGTVVGYSGIYINLVQWLSKKLRFSYTMVPVFQTRHDPLPNGTWIGTYDLLIKKEADFTACFVLLTPRVNQIVDVTTTATEVPVVFLVPPPREESRLLAPIKPFTLSVWGTLVGSLLLLSLSIYCVYYLNSKITRSKTPDIKLIDVLVSLTSVTFGQGANAGLIYARTASHLFSSAEFSLHWTKFLCLRIVLSAFCLAAIVMVNSYTGIFISFATTPKLVPVAENGEDVVFRSNLEFVGYSAQIFDSLKTSPRKPLKIFAETVLQNPQNIFPTFKETVEKVATGCCALIYPVTPLETWLFADVKKHRYCRCSITRQTEMVDFYAFGTQKRSPYTQPLSRAILENRQYGLLQFWRSNELRVPYQCYKPAKSKIRALNVSDLSGVFLLFLLGICLGSVCFVLEMAKSKILRFST